MSIESLIDAYETLLAKHKNLHISRGCDGELTDSGQYVARACVSLDTPEGEARPQQVAVAAHSNPTVAMLLAKLIAISELVSEPTFPFYEDTEFLKASQVVAPKSAPAQAAQAAAAAAPDNANRPVVSPDGKVHCWEMVEGKECGAEIKEWNGKSPADLGNERKTRYGLVLCPKHIAMRKKG